MLIAAMDTKSNLTNEDRKMKKFLLVAAGLLSTLSAAHAIPINLVTNGSFESGNLIPFVQSGGGIYPVAAIITDGSTGSAFGEAVPSDPLTTGSPDIGGRYAAYFVDDRANQTLTQTVFLGVGNYQIGFDAYDPRNGYSNPNDALFTGSIAGITLATYSVKTSPVGIWQEFNGVATIVAAGNYQVSFNFIPSGRTGGSADVIVDRVYVTPTERTGIVIPEPLTLSLFGAGLVGIAALRRRKKAKMA
jgi:hypothetical protein